MFTKLLQLVKIILSKISVFYQILAIILIMITVMVIQSFNGHQALTTIHQNTEKIYTSTSAMGQEDTSNVETDLEKIRSCYLAKLANESSVAAALEVNLNVLFNKIITIGNITDSTKQKLDSLFNQLRAITAAPAQTSNLAPLNQAVDELHKTVKFLRITAYSNNYNLFLDSNKQATKLIKTNLTIMISGAVLIILLGLLIAGLISRPLRKMVNRVKSLETGNLSNDSTSDNTGAFGSREVTQAVKGLDKAITGLRDLVTDIIEKATALDRASSELSAVSADTGKSAMEVAKSADELATSSAEQARQVSEAVECIRKLSEMVIQVTQESQRIGATSGQVAQSAALGQKVTHDVAAEINSLFETIKQAAAVINTLSSTSEEISGITAIIKGITEQTTLLALNASIEAARAGEYGRGFAVVAKKTAKLAEQSKQSTQMIAELITQMKIRSDQAVEAMQQGISRAEAGKNLAEKATVTFQEINQTLTNTIDQINSIVKSTKQMAANNDKVTEAVSTIATISEQNMASTQEVSAVSEEQNAAVEQVKALADNLRHIASSLKQAVGVFKID